MNKYMKIADELAQQNILTNDGGPFGAVIIKNNEIVGKGNNQVVLKNDPTAHAEIVAIRNACEKYLNKTDKENQLIRQLREKAKTDEKIAREIEYKNKENYVNFSKDNTLEMLQTAGYDV